MRFTLILFAFVTFAAAGHAAPDEWIRRADLPHPTANLSFLSRWQPNQGLQLQFATPDGKKTIRIDLQPAGGRVQATPPAAFPPALRAATTFATAALPAAPRDSVEVTVTFRPEAWTLYVDNRPVCQLPAPFQPPLTVTQPSAQVPPADKRGEPYVQKIADFAFHDGFLVPEDEKDTLAAWQKEAGEWLLHTAVDNSVERLTIAPGAAAKPEPSRSPNFYSLHGKGRPALITAGQDFYDTYTCEAAVQTEPGEMGLAFYVQDTGGFHAFTVKMEKDKSLAQFRLWRTASKVKPEPEILAAVTAPLTQAQWVKLKVAVFPDRVRCYIDNTEVISVALELPPGGRFGLYADSADGVRFDDVAARSNHDLDLNALRDLRRYGLEEHGNFFAGRKRFFFFPAPPRADGALEIPEARQPQWLAVGSPLHAPHVFTAIFEPRSASASVGLLAGYTAADQPHYLFLCQRNAKEELFLLERIRGGAGEILESYRVPRNPRQSGAAPLRLMCDATNGKELRLYRNDELVLIHHPDAPVGGASGVYVGARTVTDLTAVDYTFERRDLYRNKFEKNRIFIEDPFMRHWSSPEGDWIDDKAGKVWHKSDFYGRFLIRLPCIGGSQVHLGVEDGKADGALVVMVRDGNLIVTDNPALPPGGTPLKSIPIIGLAGFDGDSTSANGAARWYSIHYEGHWLWLTSGNRLLGKVPVPQPLRGHRMRIAGFSAEDLKYSYVERFNVQDFLFTESLYDWTVNGGLWEVVNRFQCQPRWSNMNGESRDGLAAIWAKYLFRGDFCIEMYAGMRHGWYDRPGDLNLTVMNRDTTTSQGYTVTCTGWDPDHSQLYTRLFRNGAVIAQSDKYLVPRVRDGSRRLGYEPLVAEGRDVHGAWYYIKFRRVGKTLEYWFDNELVFTAKDDAPLNDGAFGIWTFMNSMMVARVKIGAESIRPRPVSFTLLSAAAATPAPAPVAAAALVLLKDEQPLGAMSPELWRVEDTVGHATLLWGKESASGPYFTVTNMLGGGGMRAACALPPTAAPEIAGWRFYMKRTPRSLVNFYFAVGSLDGSGAFVPKRTFFQRISGSDLARDNMRLSGESEVKPTAAAGEGWETTGPWTPVDAWLPAEVLAAAPAGAFTHVQVLGLGNLQPSDELQGLNGNGPGEAYAVKDFAEIRYRSPRLTLKADTPAPQRLVLEDEKNGKRFATVANLADLQKAIDAIADTGLVRARLLAYGSWGVARNQLAWIRLPPKPAITCQWSRKQPGTIALQQADDSYPDPRFLAAKMTVGGMDVALSDEGVSRRVGLVPRQADFTAARLPAVPVTVTIAGTASTFSLAWKDNPLREPPCLLSVEGLTPFLQTFEARELAAPLQADPLRMRIRSFDPLQGSYLAVDNVGAANRLASAFTTSLSIAQFPAFQMRYRGPAMARVSLALKDQFFARLSESNPVAIPVRPGHTLTLDGKWHSWTGLLCDTVTTTPLNKSVFACNSLRLGSTHGVDQTGLFTQWDIDDLVLGPAVARREQLAFTPRYFSFAGVADVHIALRAGAEAYDELDKDALAALPWKPFPADQRVEPDPQGLADGLCHLFIKARDSQGQESAVTDIPFLLDRAPLQGSAAFEESTDPRYNGTALRVSFGTSGGAPLNLDQAVIRWDDTPVNAVPAFSLFGHQEATDTLLLNWPHIFRKQLNQAANGQAHRIVVANVRDGAGNAAPDVVVPLTLDYAKDKRAPTFLGARLPANILWTSAWEPVTATTPGFTLVGAAVSIVRPPDEVPFLRINVAAPVADLARPSDRQWAPAVFPQIALRLRRPVIAANDKARIDLCLDCNNGQTYVFPLTHPAKAAREIALPAPLAWKANTWLSITLDLRETLKKAIVQEEVNRLDAAGLNDPARVKTAADTADRRFTQLRVTVLRFRITDAPAHSLVDLQSPFVLAPWRPQDKIAFNAFDASGMGGMAWGDRGEKGTTELAVAPAALPPEDRAGGWLLLRAKDKAGNLSAPVLVPVFDVSGAATGDPQTAASATDED